MSATSASAVGSLVAALTRPSEMSQFREVMQSEFGRSLLAAHLADMYAAENIVFYERVLALDAEQAGLDDAAFLSRATDVYNEFVSEFAPQEININSELKADIANQLAAVGPPNRLLFEPAKRQIYKLIEKSCWLAFTKSDRYQKFVAHANH